MRLSLKPYFLLQRTNLTNLLLSFYFCTRRKPLPPFRDARRPNLCHHCRTRKWVQSGLTADYLRPYRETHLNRPICIMRHNPHRQSTAPFKTSAFSSCTISSPPSISNYCVISDGPSINAPAAVLTYQTFVAKQIAGRATYAHSAL